MRKETVQLSIPVDKLHHLIYVLNCGRQHIKRTCSFTTLDVIDINSIAVAEELLKVCCKAYRLVSEDGIDDRTRQEKRYQNAKEYYHKGYKNKLKEKRRLSRTAE